MTQAQPNTPSYRYTLKADIIRAGYRTMSEFADEIDASLTRLSRVIHGWEFPSPELQMRIAKGLGITIKQLRGLL